MKTKKELREMCGWCGEVGRHICKECGIEQEKCREESEGHCFDCAEKLEGDLK